MTTVVALSAGAVFALLRWLRVCQREHYVPGSVTRFAARWWSSRPVNLLLAGTGLAAAVLTASGFEQAAYVVAAAAAVGPVGLTVRGTSAPLRWTPRLIRLASASAVPPLAAAVWSVRSAEPTSMTLAALAVPLWVDLASAALRPLEKRISRRWVWTASRRLAEVAPRVVAITGSYGKTSTKELVRHLLAGRHSVLASPASFNNLLGLARTINEHLTPDVEVFVAEMGTYGPGEIDEMCRHYPPEVGVITALGPVHLERMGSIERIRDAKSEILRRARVGVINVDHPLLAELARAEMDRIRVVTCSTSQPEADVVCADGRVSIGGVELARFQSGVVHPGNLACAVGVLVALGEDPSSWIDRLEDLPVPPHRLVSATSERGFVVFDDTFNANPEGAREGLRRLAVAAPSGRRVLVTPGMVELGHLQYEENRRLARDAAAVVTDLVVVGRTNRKALLEGAAEGGIRSVIVVENREEAVAWVRDRLGPGDAVLYENDLPDHYP